MATKKQLRRSPEADIRTMINWKEVDQLAKTLAAIKKENDMTNFLKGLLTIRELRDISHRLEIARLLNKGLTYEEIRFQLKNVGVTTITRVGQKLSTYNDIFRKIFKNF